MSKARASIAVCFALWSLAAVGAGAQDGPKRKPGLWQQTVTTSSGPAMPPQTMSMCSDEKTDSLIAEQAGANQRCTQQSIKRQGNAYLVEAVCKDGATTIRSQGRFTGDFTSSYSGEMRTTFEPPMQGMKEMTQKIDARWVGACKPGQKPGDVVMEGRGSMNMQELMKSDPQKMQEMLQQMQKMHQPPR